MKLEFISSKHSREWFFANLFSVVLFCVYAYCFSDYTFVELVDVSIVEVAVLAFYQYSILMWSAYVYERVDVRMVLFGAFAALLMWHFSLWGWFSILALNAVEGGYNGYDPSVQVFDKQSGATFAFILGWTLVCVKGFRKKLLDLKILALSGGLLLSIAAGHHLIGYWSMIKTSEIHHSQLDERVMSQLVEAPDEEFDDVCNMILGLECYRFDVREQGYPDALLNYNGSYAPSIRNMANNPISLDPMLTHSTFFRDILFEDNYSVYYARSIYFDQRGGVATYIINNYMNDISVDFTIGMSWMMIAAFLFWSWILMTIGIAHSSKMQPRPNNFSSTRCCVAVVFNLVLAPVIAWIGFDYLFQSIIAMPLSILLISLISLVRIRAWKTFYFMGLVLLLFVPAVAMYVWHLKDALDVANPPAIELAGARGLQATAIASFLVLLISKLGFPRLFPNKKEVMVAVIALVAIAGGITAAVFHIILPDVVMGAEMIRLDFVAQSGIDAVTLCQKYPFDVCASVNNPEWKLNFFEPLFMSSWYMACAGVMTLGVSLYLVTCFGHRHLVK